MSFVDYSVLCVIDQFEFSIIKLLKLHKDLNKAKSL